MILDRRIIHVDMDAFFASVEQRDNSSLKGKPVIVGGTSDRGVVCAASYEARKYGVHSAMATYIAKQKCPHGIFVRTRHNRYKEVSNEIFNILYGFTYMVEPLSIDEAYIDVTSLNKEPLDIAYDIKKQVRRETGLTISIGISYNKFLAKLASDWNKPNGIKVITKDMIPDMLKPLSIKKVYGIGRKSADKLNRIGIFTVEDLLNLPKDYMVNFFGKYGIEIYDRIRGVDNRVIKPTRDVKSIGRETTFKEDTGNKEYLKEILLSFADNISNALNKRELSCKTVTVKFKTASFETHTKSKTLFMNISSSKDIYIVGSNILDEVVLEENIRLIGLTVSNFSDNNIEQISFFENL